MRRRSPGLQIVGVPAVIHTVLLDKINFKTEVFCDILDISVTVFKGIPDAHDPEHVRTDLHHALTGDRLPTVCRFWNYRSQKDIKVLRITQTGRIEPGEGHRLQIQILAEFRKIQFRLIFISVQIVILQFKELAHFLDLRILGFQPEVVPELHGIIKCIDVVQEFLLCISKPLMLILQRHVTE